MLINQSINQSINHVSPSNDYTNRGQNTTTKALDGPSQLKASHKWSGGLAPRLAVLFTQDAQGISPVGSTTASSHPKVQDEGA